MNLSDMFSLTDRFAAQKKLQRIVAFCRRSPIDGVSVTIRRGSMTQSLTLHPNEAIAVVELLYGAIQKIDDEAVAAGVKIDDK